MEIVKLVDCYHKSLDEFTDPYYSFRLYDYFDENKRNLSQLDHRQNGDLIVSSIQVEWTMRIKNLQNYYDKLYTSFSKPKNKKESWVSRYISWVHGDKPKTGPQLSIGTGWIPNEKYEFVSFF